MALRQRLLTWSLLAFPVLSCNSIFGIEEGKPRPDVSAAGVESGGNAGFAMGMGAGAGVPDLGGSASPSGAAGNAGSSAGSAALEGGRGGAPEAGGSASGGAGAAGVPADAGAGGQPELCPLAHWPSRPPVGDDTSLPQPLVLATSDLNYSQTSVVGRDLDNSCTCPGAPTCSSSRAPDLLCDAPGGRDASANKVLATITQNGISNFSEAALKQDIRVGRTGILLRISAYNGTPNDDRVSVELFGKAWVHPGYQLRHDGTDAWLTYAGSLNTINARSFDWDMDGYVRDGVLVAHFQTLTIALRPYVGDVDNPMEIIMDEAVISGNLSQGAYGFELKNGSLAGRWRNDRMLSAFKVFKYTGTFMCTSKNLAFPVFKDAACKYIDIMRTSSLDSQGQACDAISWGIGFTAEPARLGAEESPPITPPECDAGWNPTCF